jgi:hypothetical protein
MTRLRTAVAIATVLLALGLQAVAAEAKCPKGLQKRSTDQVLASHRAALAAADWEAVACNYAKKAFMITDQGVLVGPEEIVAWFVSLHDLFGTIAPQIAEEVFFREAVREVYRLDGGWVVIPDGVDTYRIRRGKIEWQGIHGIIEFTGPPPD